MLDGVSLDQLRTFIAAADEGSFSAAGRRLGRAQSVVSQALANLEGQLGVRLFDRSAKRPVLTDAGRALIDQARQVVGAMDGFKHSARGLAGGREPEVSAAIDVLFPGSVLTRAVGAFQAEFPETPLRLYVESLGGVLQPVLDRRCAFGVKGSLPFLPPQMTAERLCSVTLCLVAAPTHPLARRAGPIAAAAAAREVQLVLTDRSTLSQGREFGVLSSLTWRLADLGAKHTFLRAGLGWGSMPREAVAEDLAAGRLVEIDVEGFDKDMELQMSATWRTDAPPGLAGRWLIERLRSEAREAGCPA